MHQVSGGFLISMEDGFPQRPSERCFSSSSEALKAWRSSHPSWSSQGDNPPVVKTTSLVTSLCSMMVN